MDVPRVYIDGMGWRRVDRLALERKLGRRIRPGFDGRCIRVANRRVSILIIFSKEGLQRKKGAKEA